MAGKFVYLGTTPFPGPRGKSSPPLDLFEWQPRGQSGGRGFKVRFVSWDQAGRRRYFVQPLLNHWMTGEQTDFLDKACAYGYQIVAKLDKLNPDDRKFYRLARHIFRNRNAGHTKIDRIFSHARDFIDFSQPNRPSLIAPGISDPEKPGVKAPDELLRQAFREQGKLIDDRSVGKEPPNFKGLLNVYQRFIERNIDPAKKTVASPLLEVDETDALIHRLLGDSVDYRKVEAKVRSSLIFGPVFETDFLQVLDDPAGWQYFFQNILNKFCERGMTPAKFDKCLERVRRDHYIQLVKGGRKLTGDALDQARLCAEQRYCLLLWVAYRLMAHCYGVLMYAIFLDFSSHNDDPPTELEKFWFRLRHCQLDYLGGLPLAFLDRAQLRWIWQNLEGLEYDIYRHTTEVLTDEEKNWPVRFAQISEFLGILGLLVRFRREADRKTKDLASNRSSKNILWDGPRVRSGSPDGRVNKKQSYPAHGTLNGEYEPQEPGRGQKLVDDRLDGEAAAPRTTTTSELCPECGRKMQLDRMVKMADDGQPIVGCYCPNCNKPIIVQFDLSKLCQECGQNMQLEGIVEMADDGQPVVEWHCPRCDKTIAVKFDSTGRNKSARGRRDSQ